MTTEAISLACPTASRPRLTQLPDPPQRPVATQSPYTSRAHLVLESWFIRRLDVLVMQEGYLCQEAGSARGAPVPDCIVAFDLPVPPAEIIASNGYTISEIGKPPDFVLEAASKSTGERDYTTKRVLYAGYGVGEYWRFDHTGGDFHDAALAGDRLVNGKYEPIPVHPLAGGGFRGYSAALGLELRWQERMLRFWDPVTGEYLPDLIESRAQTAAAIGQRDAEADARRDAEAQRKAEADARRDAEAQRDAEAAARRDAEAQRDTEAAARRDAEAQRDTEAAARRDAEERIRELEARLARRPPAN